MNERNPRALHDTNPTRIRIQQTSTIVFKMVVCSSMNVQQILYYWMLASNWHEKSPRYLKCGFLTKQQASHQGWILQKWDLGILKVVTPLKINTKDKWSSSRVLNHTRNIHLGLMLVEIVSTHVARNRSIPGNTIVWRWTYDSQTCWGWFIRVGAFMDENTNRPGYNSIAKDWNYGWMSLKLCCWYDAMRYKRWRYLH